jgi:hypothetical protein
MLGVRAAVTVAAAAMAAATEPHDEVRTRTCRTVSQQEW